MSKGLYKHNPAINMKYSSKVYEQNRIRLYIAKKYPNLNKKLHFGLMQAIYKRVGHGYPRYN